ncbi:MAG: ATP-dependent helicase, partial [Paenibacillaceae bacterium]|nr:ATP-dependent helicase [Paenibacillaceae bacterium]
FILRKFSRELGIEIEPKALFGGKLAEAGAAPFKRTRSSGSGKAGADGTTHRASSSGTARRVGVEGNGGRSGKPAQISGKPGSRPASGSGEPRKSSPTAERKKERLQDRKNKGAPKWLKNKPPRS